MTYGALSSTYASYPFDLTTTNKITLVFEVVLGTEPGTPGVMMEHTTNVNTTKNGFFLLSRSQYSTGRLEFASQSVNNIDIGTVPRPAAGTYQIAWVIDRTKPGGQTHSFFINGVKQTVSPAAGAGAVYVHPQNSLNFLSANLYLMARSGPTLPATGQQISHPPDIYLYAMTDSDAIAASTPGGGGTPGSVTAVAATATGTAPTPTASAAATVSATAPTAAAAGVAPAVNAAATVAAVTATATGQAVAPTVGGEGGAAAPTATSTATASPPGVTAGATIEATAPTGTAQAQTPTVEAGTEGAVSPPAASASAQAAAPGVTAAATVTATVMQGTALANVPALAAAANVQAVAALATLTANAPSVHTIDFRDLDLTVALRSERLSADLDTTPRVTAALRPRRVKATLEVP